MFCGGRPLSGEHGLSAWFRTLGGIDGQGRVVVARDDEIRNEKEAPLFSQKFRVACVPCNTGWMHDLEEAVKHDVSQMLRGNPTLLVGRTQRMLATWLVKTCCVLEYADLEPGGNIPRAHYDQLYERRTKPPDGCQVWLARAKVPIVNGEPHISGWGCGRIKISDPDLPGGPQEWWFGTLRVGSLILQALGTPGGNPRLDRPHLRDRITQIWPVQRQMVNFPPGAQVTFEEMLPAAMGPKLALRYPDSGRVVAGGSGT